MPNPGDNKQSSTQLSVEELARLKQLLEMSKRTKNEARELNTLLARRPELTNDDYEVATLLLNYYSTQNNEVKYREVLKEAIKANHAISMYHLMQYYNEGNKDHNIKRDSNKAANMMVRVLATEDEHCNILINDYLNKNKSLREAAARLLITLIQNKNKSEENERNIGVIKRYLADNTLFQETLQETQLQNNNDLKSLLEQYNSVPISIRTTEYETAISNKLNQFLNNRQPFSKNNLDKELATLMLQFYFNEHLKALSNLNRLDLHQDKKDEKSSLEKIEKETRDNYIAFLKEAAAAGYAPALYNLIVYYTEGDYGLPKDPDQTSKYLTELRATKDDDWIQSALRYQSAISPTSYGLPKSSQTGMATVIGTVPYYIDMRTSMHLAPDFTVVNNPLPRTDEEPSRLFSDLPDTNSSTRAWEILNIFENEIKNMKRDNKQGIQPLIKKIAEVLKNGIAQNEVDRVNQLQEIIDYAVKIRDDSKMYYKLGMLQDLCNDLARMDKTIWTENHVYNIRQSSVDIQTAYTPPPASTPEQQTVSPILGQHKRIFKNTIKQLLIEYNAEKTRPERKQNISDELDYILKKRESLNKNNLDRELASLLIAYSHHKYIEAESKLRQTTDFISDLNAANEAFKRHNEYIAVLKEAAEAGYAPDLYTLFVKYTDRKYDLSQYLQKASTYFNQLAQTEDDHWLWLAQRFIQYPQVQVTAQDIPPLPRNEADYGVDQLPTNYASDNNQYYTLEILRILNNSRIKEVVNRESNQNMQMLIAIANELKNGINNTNPVQQLQNIINAAKSIIDKHQDDIFDLLDYNQRKLCGFFHEMDTNSLTQNHVNRLRAMCTEYYGISKPQLVTNENSTPVLRMAQHQEPEMKHSQSTHVSERAYAQKIVGYLNGNTLKSEIKSVNAPLLNKVWEKIWEISAKNNITPNQQFQEIREHINGLKVDDYNKLDASLQNIIDEIKKMSGQLNENHVRLLRDLCEEYHPSAYYYQSQTM